MGFQRAFRSVVMAFSMFSRVPMPHIDWREESMRYTFVAFPLVGIVIALVLWGWQGVAGWLSLNSTMTAIGFTVLPVLITGGIHMDGFCDTVDALSSYGDREKKLAILKDPHIGAFAMIYSIVYMLVIFGCFSMLTAVANLPLLLGVVLVISRTLGGWAVVCWTNAKKDGLARTFSDNAARRIVRTALFLWFIAGFGVVFYMQWRLGLCLLAAMGLPFFIVRRLAVRQFGGVTGDIAGFLIQMSELCALLAMVLCHQLFV